MTERTVSMAKLKRKHHRNWIDAQLHPSPEGRELAREKLKHAIRQAKTGAHRRCGSGSEVRAVEMGRLEPLAVGREYAALARRYGNKARASREVSDKYPAITGHGKKLVEKLDRWANGQVPPT